MSTPSPFSRRINRLVFFQHRSEPRFLISTRWLLIHHLQVLLTLYRITQNKGLVMQKRLSVFDFHRFLQFPVLTNLSFTKKRFPCKILRTKRTFSKKSFLSFSRTDNVQSNITTMRALKFDQDGPGFSLEEYSKAFVQVYLISLLLKKQMFRTVTRQLSQPNWYWNCISLPFFLQRQKELFSENGFQRFSLQNWECCEKRIIINLLEKLEWNIQF